jgi:hypothetical protein
VKIPAEAYSLWKRKKQRCAISVNPATAVTTETTADTVTTGCRIRGAATPAPATKNNISDAHVGGGNIGWRGGIFGHFGYQPNEGYALDQNRNGRYDRGRDGVLVFDTNRDGKYDKKDVQNTNNMMQLGRGNYDFNNDGRVSFAERIQGAWHRARYSAAGHQPRRTPGH